MCLCSEVEKGGCWRWCGDTGATFIKYLAWLLLTQSSVILLVPALESFHPATAWQPGQETSTICLLSHQHPGPSLIGTVFIIFLQYDLGQDADCCQQRSRILLILDSDSRAKTEPVSLCEYTLAPSAGPRPGQTGRALY